MHLTLLILFILFYHREILRYGYEETGMALGTASERAVDGYGRIIGKRISKKERIIIC